MGKLSCNCLNVQIHTKSDLCPWNATNISDEQQSVSCCKEFFGQDLSEVLLNLEGVCVAHPGLVRTRACGAWLVHQCVNCDVFSHATNTLVPDDCRILVHSALISDEKAMECLMSCDDYSPAFKIVLKSIPDSALPPLSTDQMSPEVRSELESIQNQLNTFLVTEEKDMEERIRSYEQLEREKYARLQSKARSDKNVMMSRLLSTVYRNVSESLSDAMIESPVGSLADQVHAMHVSQTHATGDHPPSADEPSRPAEPDLPDSPPRMHNPTPFCPNPITEDDDGGDDDMLFPLPRLPVARSNSVNPKQLRSSLSSQLESVSPLVVSRDFETAPVPIDDVFQFDPGFQEDPNEPFSDTDEDINDTDDSSQVDDGIQRSSHSSGSSNQGGGRPVSTGGVGGGGPAPGAGFSTSVPIDVPAWMGSSTQHHVYQFDDEDDLDSVPRDPARMAASIQAMARSVHGHTSDLFGELPKPPTHASVSGRRTSSRH